MRKYKDTFVSRKSFSISLANLAHIWSKHYCSSITLSGFHFHTTFSNPLPSSAPLWVVCLCEIVIRAYHIRPTRESLDCNALSTEALPALDSFTWLCGYIFHIYPSCLDFIHTLSCVCAFSIFICFSFWGEHKISMSQQVFYYVIRESVLCVWGETFLKIDATKCLVNLRLKENSLLQFT